MTGAKKASSAPRIGSGLLRGMVLTVPEGGLTRPTSSKVRAAVMNALQGVFPGAIVLDLFAGSGAVGLEAVSRGAVECHFVELDRRALVCLRENCNEGLRRFRVQKAESPELLQEPGDVMAYLRKLKIPGGRSFDIIWADPPYELVPRIADELLALATAGLKPGGMFLLESGNEWQAKESGEGWRLSKERVYGETRISFFERAT